MLGDSTWDCRAAANAGVETIAVLASGFSEQELREAGAVAVSESIDELRRRLSDPPLG
jgi:phosphoglycolate phosphatase-like HAD superfamily hydrolase